MKWGACFVLKFSFFLLFNLNVFIHLFIFFAWLGHHQNEWNKFYSISFFVCAYVFSVTVKWLEYYISTCSKTASLLLLLCTFLFLNSTINTSFFSIHFISSSFFFIREIHHNHHHHHSPIYSHTQSRFRQINWFVTKTTIKKIFTTFDCLFFTHTLISFSWIYYPIKNKCELWILVKKKIKNKIRMFACLLNIFLWSMQTCKL